MSPHSKPADASCTESSISVSPENLEPKVTAKAEPPTKVEEQPCSSNSEVAMLKALLTQKSEEALKRELKLRTEIMETEKQNKRLKLKRAADAARIESLEAELARIKKVAVKDEQNDSQVINPSSKGLASNEAISIVDSEEESGRNAATSTPAEVQIATLAGSTSPVRDRPAPSLSERPSRDAWRSSTPDSSNRRTSAHQHDSNPDNTAVVVKDEEIDVIIKTEGEPDQLKRVTLIKSEDGNFDIWNVDGFGLGPTIAVDEKYNRGFTRKVIGDAFGGGHVVCEHHWHPKPGQETKTPFLTFSRSWNNALPVRPGMHGMGFFGMSSSPVKTQPLNFFVGEGTNDWRLLGTYNYTRWGEIAPHHISLLPPLVLDSWVNGMLSSQWGKSSIEDTNATLEAPRRVELTSESVLQALQDGRLGIPFTILQCVGYPADWFEDLLHYEKHPKPAKPKAKKSGKRRGPQAQGSPKKQARTMQKGKQKGKREHDEEDELEDEPDASRQIGRDSDSSDSEYLEGPRRIAALPTRTSPRKSPRTKSVEL
ncbi:hypothetical protein FB451DRAFT_684879 [Mycena latifolia]|nr:hypothetical protein FB451DRAFT_684879 [Mycena latifolia]